MYGLSSRAPVFQYSSQGLVSESLKEMTDSDTSPFGDTALSMKENLTVFDPTVVTAFWWSGCIRVGASGVGVSGMGALLLILQALGYVGVVSSWLVVESEIGAESAKRTFFLCGSPQFEIISSIGRIHDLIGIAAGSNMIDIDDCERKKVDNIDAKELTDLTLLFLTSSEVDYEIRIWWKQKLMIARDMKASWQYRCKRFDWIDFSVFDRNSEIIIRKPQFVIVIS